MDDLFDFRDNNGKYHLCKFIKLEKNILTFEYTAPINFDVEFTKMTNKHTIELKKKKNFSQKLMKIIHSLFFFCEIFTVYQKDSIQNLYSREKI